MHRVRRAIPLLALAAACAAPPAGATAAAASRPAAASIGRARVAAPLRRAPAARAELLVPVRYPLAMKGRDARVRVTLRARGRVVARASASARLAAGPARHPDRRRRFAFVHRVALGPGADAALARAGTVRLRVAARAVLDADGDGRAEARAGAVARQRLRVPALLELRPAPVARRSAVLCASLPELHVAPGRATRIALPSCDRGVRWTVAERPAHGRAGARGRTLTYRPAAGHRGRDELTLRARAVGGGARASQTAETVAVQLVVGGSASSRLVVRAIGDSVTAGFGYYADGSAMSIFDLPRCRPADTDENDACSSNALNRSSGDGPVRYAPDYGLANGIAWPARWAGRYGITNYANYAISGSAPADWAPGGQFHVHTQAVAADDPDYVVLTLGANPLLSDVLFGVDKMGCAVYADLFGGFARCVERWFAKVGLVDGLTAVYRELLTRTDAQILLMQYHLAIPSSALLYSSHQIAQVAAMTNATIAAVAAGFGDPRLRVVAPPHFDVGIDMTPFAPNAHSCSTLGYQVDGQSVQATPTQAELLISHPLSFCSGPAGGGEPWVIAADTGIHPSATGHAQMASALPAP